MRKADVVEFFRRTQGLELDIDVARAIGISKQAFSDWGEIIPEGRAARLSLATQGGLKYDPAIYEALDRRAKRRRDKQSGRSSHAAARNGSI